MPDARDTELRLRFTLHDTARRFLAAEYGRTFTAAEQRELIFPVLV